MIGLADETATYSTTDYRVSHATGFVHSQKSHAFLQAAPRVSFVKTETDAPVPAKASLRGKVGPVEDQGQCGSCWDFSLTNTLRGTWIAHGKDPGRLSFNYLLNCDKTQAGCNGGDFSAAAMFVTPKGAPAYGSDGSYVARDGKCQPQTAVASTLSYTLLGDDSGQFPNNPAPSFQDIAYVVGVMHQPVSIDITATDDWQNYSSGVYNNCNTPDPNQINHMVIIEGYDCEKNVDKNGNCVFDKTGNLPPGQGVWLVRNSWGESWGDGGYVKMIATDKKGNKCNSIAHDALFFNVTGK